MIKDFNIWMAYIRHAVTTHPCMPEYSDYKRNDVEPAHIERAIVEKYRKKIKAKLNERQSI